MFEFQVLFLFIKHLLLNTRLYQLLLMSKNYQSNNSYYSVQKSAPISRLFLNLTLVHSVFELPILDTPLEQDEGLLPREGP